MQVQIFQGRNSGVASCIPHAHGEVLLADCPSCRVIMMRRSIAVHVILERAYIRNHLS